VRIVLTDPGLLIPHDCRRDTDLGRPGT
jgi:hypothetical protein